MPASVVSGLAGIFASLVNQGTRAPPGREARVGSHLVDVAGEQARRPQPEAGVSSTVPAAAGAESASKHGQDCGWGGKLRLLSTILE